MFLLRVLSKNKLLIAAVLIFSITMAYSEEKKIRSIYNIVSDIRKELGLKDYDVINPDKVSAKLLEELGNSLVDFAIGNHDRHMFMDQMMGGEGSSNLSAMRQRIGYNYINANTNNQTDMPEFKGMMSKIPDNNINRKKSFFPMMWNNGFGMMRFGFGGWFMGIIYFLIIIAICLAVFFIVKNNIKSTARNNETPLEILKKRYAKGEISKEEFEKIKNDIL
jgi:putative membrane protein